MAPAFFQSGGKSERSIISNNKNFDYFKVLFQRYLCKEMNSYYTLMTLSLLWWICSNHLGNHLNLSFRASRKILKHFHQNWPMLTFCQEVFLERDMPGDLSTREPGASLKTSWARTRLVSQLKGKGGPSRGGQVRKEAEQVLVITGSEGCLLYPIYQVQLVGLSLAIGLDR